MYPEGCIKLGAMVTGMLSLLIFLCSIAVYAITRDATALYLAVVFLAGGIVMGAIVYNLREYDI